MFVGSIGALPALPGAVPAVLVISALAAGVTALLRPMAWYLTAIVGAAIGFAGAFIVSVYAISRI
jgi:ABC-type xylose transport system permease subunit